MNHYKNIKEAKKVIEFLTNQISQIKSDSKKQFTVDVINTIINLINSLEVLLNAKQNTDVIDKLILSRIYTQVFASYQDYIQDGSLLDVGLIARNIGDNIRYPKEILVSNITNCLETWEIEEKINQNKLNELGNAGKDWSRMLKELVEEIKVNIN